MVSSERQAMIREIFDRDEVRNPDSVRVEARRYDQESVEPSDSWAVCLDCGRRIRRPKLTGLMTWGPAGRSESFIIEECPYCGGPAEVEALAEMRVGADVWSAPDPQDLVNLLQSVIESLERGDLDADQAIDVLHQHGPTRGLADWLAARKPSPELLVAILAIAVDVALHFAPGPATQPAPPPPAPQVVVVHDPQVPDLDRDEVRKIVRDVLRGERNKNRHGGTSP